MFSQVCLEVYLPGDSQSSQVDNDNHHIHSGEAPRTKRGAEDGGFEGYLEGAGDAQSRNGHSDPTKCFDVTKGSVPGSPDLTSGHPTWSSGSPQQHEGLP